MRNLYTIITFFTILSYLSAAILVLRAWKQGKAQRRFFFLLVFTAIWLTHIFLESHIRNNFQIYRLLNYSEPIVASVISYIFVIFTFHFPRSSEKLSISKEIVLFIPVIMLAIANFSNKIYIVRDYNVYEVNKGWYLIYIATLITYFLILGGGTLIRKYLRLKGFSRLQLKYLLLGYMISVILALCTSIYNALIHWLSDDQYLIFTNVIVLFALSSAYAIVKHRLFDIRFVLRKGFVHAISLIILLALYTYLILSFQNYFELNRPLTTLIAVLVICLTIYPLRKFLSRNIDALFFAPEKREVSLQKFSSLASGLGLEELLEKAKMALTQGLDVLEIKIFILDESQREFRAEYPREIKGRDSIDEENGLIKYLKKKKEIVVRGEIPYLIQGLEEREAEEFKEIEKELKRENAEVVVPLGEENIFGLIFLGNKKSQAAFTVQDIRFLNSFSRQFTIYLGNVLLYQQALKRVERMAGER